MYDLVIPRLPLAPIPLRMRAVSDQSTEMVCNSLPEHNIQYKYSTLTWNMRLAVWFSLRYLTQLLHRYATKRFLYKTYKPIYSEKYSRLSQIKNYLRDKKASNGYYVF